jgi:hypothetical protein
MFSAIQSYIKEHQTYGDGYRTVFLKNIRLCNYDQPTTDFMQAELEFICKTSIPSIEYA